MEAFTKVHIQTKERVVNRVGHLALQTPVPRRRASRIHFIGKKEREQHSETKSCNPIATHSLMASLLRVLLRHSSCPSLCLCLRARSIVMTITAFRLPLFLMLLLLLLDQAPPAQALLLSYHYGPSPLSKWQEKVYRQRMSVCYQDIDIGLWGEACKASAIDKENCAMNCLSSACYESIYGADPLEEGELDVRRGREFRFCVRKAERAEKDGLHVSM